VIFCADSLVIKERRIKDSMASGRLTGEMGSMSRHFAKESDSDSAAKALTGDILRGRQERKGRDI